MRARGFQPTPPPALVDGHRRSVRYLRLSVTDRCNFRCRYCMPEEGLAFVPRTDLLTFEEIELLVRAFARLGVTRVRLTGGEPTLRRDIVELVSRLAAIETVEDLAMTTNGWCLDRLAAPLAEAGLERLNISIDTLKPERFRSLTRTGELGRVVDGIRAAREAGLGPVKLNAVVVRGFNDDELGDLVRFAADEGALLRFIEYMPIGLDGFWSGATFVPLDEVLESLSGPFEISDSIGRGARAEVTGEGPAVYRLLRPRDGGEAVKVGFIHAVSHAFCSSCNRVRVSATGTLQECLAFAGEVSLRDVIRAGADAETLSAAIEDALFGKAAGHRFDASTGGVRVPLSMSVTGG